MDRISPNLIKAFILARSWLGLLPVIFHKIGTHRDYGPCLMFLQHESAAVAEQL